MGIFHGSFDFHLIMNPPSPVPSIGNHPTVPSPALPGVLNPGQPHPAEAGVITGALEERDVKVTLTEFFQAIPRCWDRFGPQDTQEMMGFMMVLLGWFPEKLKPFKPQAVYLSDIKWFHGDTMKFYGDKTYNQFKIGLVWKRMYHRYHHRSIGDPNSGSVMLPLGWDCQGPPKKYITFGFAFSNMRTVSFHSSFRLLEMMFFFFFRTCCAVRGQLLSLSMVHRVAVSAKLVKSHTRPTCKIRLRLKIAHVTEWP